MEQERGSLVSPSVDVPVVEGELVAAIRRLADCGWGTKAIARELAIARNTVRRYPRFRTQLTAAFGGKALLLSALGIFSVLAYLVGQRTRELAVRRAVGAGSADVIRLVVGQGLRLLAFGLLLGLTSALVGSRLLTGLLYETSPWDFITYASVVGDLTVAATLAMLLPAIRAAAIDPLIALRHE